MANNQTTLSPFARTLFSHIRAGYQCLAVNTSEEARIHGDIFAAVRADSPSGKHKVVNWDLVNGFTATEDVRLPQSAGSIKDPIAAITALIGDEKMPEGVYVFRDLDDFLTDSIKLRRLIYGACTARKFVSTVSFRMVIIVSSKLKIPEKLKSAVTVVEYDLPAKQHMFDLFDMIVAGPPVAKTRLPQNEQAQFRDACAQAMLGLTSREAENAMARALVLHEELKWPLLDTIKHEKADILRKGEVLTYVDENKIANRNDIGGFDNLLRFIDQRRAAYTPEAEALSIDYPKGIMLVGLPGTGKSYCAAAIAKVLGMPLYILDVGSIFGSLVGQSEQRMREVIKTIEAQKGCVVLVDEADKAFGGVNEANDSGVSKRIFGQFLTWLSSKKDRTFVVMTLNRADRVPPELTRAGRFDATFWVDLPFPSERRQILEIHLRRRNATAVLTDPEWDAIIEKTDEFVGSELENVVVSARAAAFQARKSGTPTFEELLVASAGVIPLAKSKKAEMDAIRSFSGDSQALPVSTQVRQTKSQPAANRRVTTGTAAG